MKYILKDKKEIRKKRENTKFKREYKSDQAVLSPNLVAIYYYHNVTRIHVPLKKTSSNISIFKRKLGTSFSSNVVGTRSFHGFALLHLLVLKSKPAIMLHASNSSYLCRKTVTRGRVSKNGKKRPYKNSSVK